MATKKDQRRAKIKRRIRKTIRGTKERPRLSVYKSNKQIYAQIIDDVQGHTLASSSSLKMEEVQSVPKIEQATAVGKAIAEAAKKAKVEQVAFDRNGYRYHGRVKSLAEAAKEGGLKF